MSQHKIALVSAFPPSSNSLNEYGFHLAKSFAKRKDVREVVIIADKLPSDRTELDLGPKIRVKRVWSFNGLRTPWVIRRAIKEEAPDLALSIYIWQALAAGNYPQRWGFLALLWPRNSNGPTGVIAHNLFLGVDLEKTHMKGKPIRQYIIRLGGDIVTQILLRADYLTVTLGSYFEKLKQIHPKAEIHLVPHGTFDAPRKVKPYQERPEIICTMGKFGTYKKLETLLQAFCKVKPFKSSEGPQLVIGGTDHPQHPTIWLGLKRNMREDKISTSKAILQKKMLLHFLMMRGYACLIMNQQPAVQVFAPSRQFWHAAHFPPYRRFYRSL